VRQLILLPPGAYEVAARTRVEMETGRPATLDAMSGITGVGAVKLERFGAEFLAVLTGAAPAPLHPARMKLAGAPGGFYAVKKFARRHRAARGGHLPAGGGPVAGRPGAAGRGEPAGWGLDRGRGARGRRPAPRADLRLRASPS